MAERKAPAVKSAIGQQHNEEPIRAEIEEERGLSVGRHAHSHAR
jgi:hypothetical protein